MDDTTLAQASRLTDKLREPGAKPVFLTGAGISLASGIPTFRGTDPDAVWANDVMEMATNDYFETYPERSWAWYGKRFLAYKDAKPNPAHEALAAIEEKLPETWVVTQNVDGLHKDAGSKNLIEVHGSARLVRCTHDRRCANAAPRGTLNFRPELITELMAAEEPDRALVPTCPGCGNILRPHVLWFDEMYLDHEEYGWDKLHDLSNEMTVLIFIGTSNSVGVTMIAMESAHNMGVPMFSIDPNFDLIGADVSIRAKAEEILPLIARSL